ncbi:hypothetical protein F2Q69_00032797 [Brassica cretica]|uniref:Uncharacterized protein n=1 Tax=Brassica cretica TaxID=69181 RepID=A0A8S9SEC8_BRACR|nr:hypothetical protein F2Q69_00032797 [Brassica cretica]
MQRDESYREKTIVDGEAPVSLGDDGGLVDEKLLGGAIVGGDETESLGIVEPIHLPGESSRRLIL